MTTKFARYASIENHYQARAVDAFAEVVPADEDVVFTEKIHGANVQVFIDKDHKIQLARRNGFFTEGESFQGAREYFEARRQVFVDIGAHVFAENPDATAISVCGEWFGGGRFPGIEDNRKTVAQVQKGVVYSPERHFCAFDIQVLRADDSCTYLDWAAFTTTMDRFSVFRVEELHRMTAGELVLDLRAHNTVPARPPTFESTIPARLGLSTEALGTNLAEGYVIRPVRCHFTLLGSRAIFKYKNPTFAETARAPKQPRQAKNDSAVESQWAVLEQEFFAQEPLRNRLDNVLSKDSYELTDNRVRGSIVRALATDVLEEARKTYVDFQWHVLEKRVGGRCSAFVSRVVASAQ